MRSTSLPVWLVALPLLEIAGFVIVGREIGVLWTMSLVLAATIAGSILLRVQGFGVLSRIRRDMQAKRDPSREIAHGIMILLAGILLIIPGFFTDIIGLLFFVPPVRDYAWRRLQARIQRFAGSSLFAAGFRTTATRADGTVIDLDADDYSTPAKDRPQPRPRIDRT